MAVQTERITVESEGHCDVLDLTEPLSRLVQSSGLSAGTATLFVPGSTAGLSTIEFEPGAVKDIRRVLETIAPENGEYAHHATWGDDNGSSHVRSCLVGPSLVVPFAEAVPILGTWQQVVLLDFDTRPRRREIVVLLMGE